MALLERGKKGWLGATVRRLGRGGSLQRISKKNDIPHLQEGKEKGDRRRAEHVDAGGERSARIGEASQDPKKAGVGRVDALTRPEHQTEPNTQPFDQIGPGGRENRDLYGREARQRGSRLAVKHRKKKGPAVWIAHRSRKEKKKYSEIEVSTHLHPSRSGKTRAPKPTTPRKAPSSAKRVC